MEERRKVFYTRRIIFLLMAIALAVPLIFNIGLPIIVTGPAKDLYDVLDKVSPDKIVVVSANWEAGTQGETAPQTEAIVRHLLKNGTKFAIWGWAYPPGPELAERIVDRVAPEYGKKYGVDWVNWGFTQAIPSEDAVIRAWSKDVQGLIKRDYKGTPLKKLPVMQNVHSAEDFGAIVEVTGSPTVGLYIRFLRGIYGTPVGYACTGVMAAEAFPYLDSKQLIGMLRGLAGAAEYESLVGFQGEGTRRMSAQSFAHLLIIVLIIAGNAGYFLSRRRAAGNQQGVR